MFSAARDCSFESIRIGIANSVCSKRVLKADTAPNDAKSGNSSSDIKAGKKSSDKASKGYAASKAVAPSFANEKFFFPSAKLSSKYTSNISKVAPNTSQIIVPVTTSANPLTKIFQIERLLSKRQCEHLIQEAEAYARNAGGWTYDRHKYFPTVDIPVNKSPELMRITSKMNRDMIIPKVRELYEIPNACITPCDQFVVKYEVNRVSSNAKTGLDFHRDGSIISFIILLNSESEFIGGGTKFECINQTIKPKQGGLVLFCGKLRHGGETIVTGKRYILVGFLEIVDQSLEYIGRDDKKNLKRDDVWLNALWKPLRKYWVGDKILVKSTLNSENNFLAIVQKIVFGTGFILVRRCRNYRTQHDFQVQEKIYATSIISVVSRVDEHKRQNNATFM
jgi:hypothetical protein